MGHSMMLTVTLIAVAIAWLFGASVLWYLYRCMDE